MDPDRMCDNCGRWVERDEVRYVMKVVIVADPSNEVDLDPLRNDDIRRDLEELVRSMEDMTDEECEEAIDQVHEAYEFNLCPECRQEVHDRLKRRTKILGQD